MEFPYEKVYAHFARTLVDKKLKQNPIPPTLYSVLIANEAIVVEGCPVNPFFASSNAKAELGRVIRAVLPYLKPDMGLVLISESWVKTTNRVNEAQHDRTRSLEFDPDATEAIVIMIYGPGGEARVGMLPIVAGRMVEYGPLSEANSFLAGRLSLHPDSDPNKAAAMASDAVRKAKQQAE
jgi:hypothetical protein